MKQLLTLTCMGLFCLLLSQPTNAQVSRKGDQGTPKVILKKDQEEPASERNESPEPEVSRERTSTQNRTQTGGRTYPGRQQEPATQQKDRQYPRSDRKYPTDDRYENNSRGDRAGYAKRGKRGKGKFKANHHDDHCKHPGKGRHLGWHKVGR